MGPSPAPLGPSFCGDDIKPFQGQPNTSLLYRIQASVSPGEFGGKYS